MSDGETDRGNHVALVSGGMDSAVAAHVSVRWGPADLLVYLDTGTGLDANREYVEEFADAVGAQLWTPGRRIPTRPRRDRRLSGPAEHGRMYRKLKERQIGRLATLRRPREHVGPPPVDWRAPAGVGAADGERHARARRPAVDVARADPRLEQTGLPRVRRPVRPPAKRLVGRSGAPVTASAAVSGRPRRRSTSKPPATSITPTGCGTSNVTPTPTTSAAGGRGEHSPTPRPARSVSTPDR